MTRPHSTDGRQIEEQVVLDHAEQRLVLMAMSQLSHRRVKLAATDRAAVLTIKERCRAAIAAACAAKYGRKS